jgi:hydrogenase-4 component F
MSGVLLSVAFYALLRFKVIADAVLGTGYLRGLLVTASLLSLAVAASLMIAQRDYKRLLAYSSIEHMGLIALATAIGTPLAISAGLLHMLGHGIGKAVVFCASGEIALAQGTTEIRGVRGLLTRQPATGATFGVGVFALLGFPPFSLFASELGIARAGIGNGLGWAVAVALALLLVAFVAIAFHVQRMLLGEPPSGQVGAGTAAAVDGPLVAGLLVAAALGVSIWPIERLLDAAATVITG